ncbi:MAG: phage Gp37/Gp68 family protein [Pseudomonadota bacterium]
MAENSGIEWTHHTWNPWVGCTKVSAACDFCYAEGWAKRAGRDVWGPKADRQRTKTQGYPIKWNKRLEGTGRRERVFTASLADVFDNHNSIQPEWRASMWETIKACPNLDFLLLTKRPQNMRRFMPDDWGDGYPNVWLGTTVEDQAEADRRIPHLLSVPAVVRFLSCEPLLGPIDVTAYLSGCFECSEICGFRSGDEPFDERCTNCGTTDQVSSEQFCSACGHQAFVAVCPECDADAVHSHPDTECLSWVITGGESGPNFRSANPDWVRSLRDQCAEADVPFLFKQWEGKTQAQIKAMGRELDGVVHDGYPTGFA